MEALLPKTTIIEQECQGGERLSREKVVYLGRLAIRLEQLGINDPLTHLFQYLDMGEGAIIGIKEDIVTDIAERLPKTQFVNHVDFKFVGNDFVSAKDRVSMDSMTTNNLETITNLLSTNSGLRAEYDRAVVEAEEVPKLASWFSEAAVGDYLVFESLPIGDQKFAVSRIYQKQSDVALCGSFVSLHNPTIEGFNELRIEMEVSGSDCKTELDILKNNYEFYNSKLTKPDDFIEFYVGVHDQLLKEKNGKNYHFGIEQSDGKQKQEGLAKVRSLPKLTAAYLDMIGALARSEGIITSEMLRINSELGVRCDVIEGQDFTMKEACDILSEVILGIVSTIDKADSKQLEELRHVDSSQGDSYAAISHYGGQARAAGESYSSGGCPEINSNNVNNASDGNNSEFGILSRSFNVWGLKDFGEGHIGVCRIENCPSRGDNPHYHKKVMVGGCDICVGCHRFFETGKSPAKIYAERKKAADVEFKRKADNKKRRQAAKDRIKKEQILFDIELKRREKQKEDAAADAKSKMQLGDHR